MLQSTHFRHQKRNSILFALVLALQVLQLLTRVAASAISAPANNVIRNLARGSALKMAADLSGGLPMEVWKSSAVLEHIRAKQTKPNRKPVSTLQVLQTLLQEKGLQGMWTGCSARMLEGFLSGAVLLGGKEGLKRSLLASPAITKTLSPAVIGFVAGAGGGAAQAIVMAPTSFLVTATTASKDGQSVLAAAREVWSREGLRGIYRGSSAVAARQATNWASRQGFTELIRPRIKVAGVPGEILAGCLGGTISCWNTPFEVARIYSQSTMYITNNKKRQQSKGGRQPTASTLATLRTIVQEDGIGGLYVGLVPRIAQACYQTVFLVCIPRIMDV